MVALDHSGGGLRCCAMVIAMCWATGDGQRAMAMVIVIVMVITMEMAIGRHRREPELCCGRCVVGRVSWVSAGLALWHGARSRTS